MLLTGRIGAGIAVALTAWLVLRFLVEAPAGVFTGVVAASLCTVCMSRFEAPPAQTEVFINAVVAGAEVKTNGDQRCVAALPFVAGDMLHRDARRLSRELGQPCLVEQVSTAGLNADGAHVLQARDR